MNILKLIRNPGELYERRGEILPRLADEVIHLGYRFGCVADRNGRALRSLRNIHRGRRAFIIGNGPSLRVSDLTLLKDEITFASNKIYLAFDQTEWRPTYYSVTDRLVAKNNREIIQGLGVRKVFSDQVREYFSGDPAIVWIKESARNMAVLAYCDGAGPPAEARFSRNALVCVDGGWSVVYAQLQLAYYMGIREVVLIGLDFSFLVPEKRVETHVRGYGLQIEGQGEVNHFHPQYRKAGEAWSMPRLDCMRLAFEAAERLFRSEGGRVVNASRKTQLEVFERRQFEDILQKCP